MASNYLRKILILGHGGFNRTNNTHNIPETDFYAITNCDIHGGALAKMHGASKYNSTAIDTDARIQGMAIFPSHSVTTFTERTNNVAASGDDCFEYTNDGGSATVDIDEDMLKVGYDDYTTYNTGWVAPDSGSTFGHNPPFTGDWSNTNNVLASDNTYASCTTGAAAGYSSWLRFNKSFSNIDPRAKIVGVELKIERKAGTALTIKDSGVNRVGAQTTSGLEDTAYWPASDTTYTYGSPTTTWGFTTINSFAGMQLQVFDTTVSSKVAYVDYAEMKVYYKLPRYSLALRFPTVNVPSGATATIVNANLRLTAYSTHSDVVSNGGSNYVCKQDHTSGSSSEPGVGGSWTTYWRIQSSDETANAAPSAWATSTAYEGSEEAAINTTIRGINETDADCDVFTDGTGDPPTSRTLVGGTTWGLPLHLGAGLEYESPDIFDIVQNQIDNANWAANQALGFVVEFVTGGGEPNVIKDFYSYDEGTAAYKAELYIKYSTEAVASETIIACTSAVSGSNNYLVDVAASGAHTTLHTWTNYTGDGTSAPVFTEGTTTGGKKMFCFNGEDTVQMWDGTAGTTTNITNPSSDWTGSAHPEGGVIHQNRMFAWGVNTNPHTLYYSKINEHDDFTDVNAGSLEIDPGTGEKIVCAYSYLGRLFVLKYPYGIYWVDTSRGMSWAQVSKLTDSVGGAGPRCMAAVDKDALFVGSDGFVHYIRGVNSLGDAESSKVLPEKLRVWVEDTVALSTLNRATIAYSSLQGVAYVLLGLKTGTYSKIALGIDQQAYRPRLLEYNRDNAECIISHNNEIYFGGVDGYIYKTEYEEYNKDSNAYTAEFQTHELELAPHGVRRANLHEMTIFFQGEGQHDCDFDIYRDGVLSQSFSAQVTGNSLVKRHRERLYGDCNTIKIVGRNSTVDEKFLISKITIGFKPGNDRI